MAKQVLCVVLLLLLSACGPAFQAGSFEDAEAGAAGREAAAGFAGLGTAGSALGLAGAGGASAGSAGAASAGSAGSEPGWPVPATEPCSNPVEFGASLSVGTDTCYRTGRDFDTLFCENWEGRSLKINGAPAVCNRQGTHPPAYDGWNYFEISGGKPSLGRLTIFFLNNRRTVPCKSPITVSGGEVTLGTKGALCLRTTELFNSTVSTGMDDRKLIVNGQPIPMNMQAGFPPSTEPDGSNYIEVSAGADPNAILAWQEIPLP